MNTLSPAHRQSQNSQKNEKILRSAVGGLHRAMIWDSLELMIEGLSKTAKRAKERKIPSCRLPS